MGGLAMGSIAAARRTQSSFPAYVASTHPSDLNGVTAFINPMPGNAGVGYAPSIETPIPRLPHVTKAYSESGLDIIPLGRRGAPESPAAYPASAGEVIGLDDAVPSNLDNLSLVLKTLGFTRRQLSAAVAWQSTVAVGIGTVVGVPLGIIVGRSLWITFAPEIDVVPIPTVPAPTVVLIVLGALLLANLVAAVPARLAARTPTALLLR